jgi:protein-tyrosine phosphatase
MIDVHAHILPCDHGCDSVEMSLEQLRLAQKNHVRTIIATPHYDCRKESVRSFLERRNAALESVRNAMDSSMTVEIVPFAEISLEHGIETVADLELIALGAKRYLLVELSREAHGDWSYEALFALEKRGFCPIIAHLHRYSKSTQEKLLQFGFHAQINIECKKNRAEWKTVQGWISNHQVHFVGSDIHGLLDESYRDFRKFYRRLPKKQRVRFQKNASVLLEK